MKKTGIELIAEERQRQIDTEGFTSEHDELYDQGELALAGACYALAEDVRDEYKYNSVPAFWPFGLSWWKPSPDNRVKELVKAGALIAAEIDRLNGIK